MNDGLDHAALKEVHHRCVYDMNDYCAECDCRWPCETAVLIAEIERLRDWLATSPSPQEIDAAAKAMYEHVRGVGWDGSNAQEMWRDNVRIALFAARNALMSYQPEGQTP